MECPTCGAEVLKLTGRFVDGEMKYSCKTCNNEYKPLPSIQNCDSFTAHYDSQLGQFFESKEHKVAYLKSKGLTQVSGTMSPKHTEGAGRLVCSRSQYQNHKKYLGD